MSAGLEAPLDSILARVREYGRIWTRALTGSTQHFSLKATCFQAVRWFSCDLALWRFLFGHDTHAEDFETKTCVYYLRMCC